MSEEKRIAGDYEIIHAMHIGDTEIVVGENPTAAEGHRYMCGFCESNILFTRYDDIKNLQAAHIQHVVHSLKDDRSDPADN